MVYAGTGANGAYASQDGGKTWQSDSAGLPSGSDIYTLFWSPSAQTLYAGLVGHGIFSLPNGQQNWQSSGQGLPAQIDVFAFAELAGQGGQHGSLFAGTSAGLYASPDGGHSWQAPPSGSGLPAGRVLSLATQFRAPTALYAGTDSAVYRSTDSGRHWSVYAPGLSGHIAAIVVVAQRSGPPVVFAAAGPIERTPSPVPGPSITTLVIAAILIAMLFLWLRRRRRMYDDLLRRQEEARGRGQNAHEDNNA